MANIILKDMPSPLEKLDEMRQSAMFDIADGDGFAKGDFSQCFDIGDACSGSFNPGGIILPKNIKAAPSPPKVPKMFVSNDCIFNCAYCGCRRSNDIKRRYVNTPKEMADLSVKTAESNGNGVFITSAICKNSDYTEELILETLKIIRNEYKYGGYVHAKIMPGADPLLIRQVGYLADRISVNIELPHSDGYKTIAKQKNKTNILTPMHNIHDYINELNPKKGLKERVGGRAFAPSGQTTQMMVGTMNESDRTIAVLAESLYKKFDMRRVYYSPFSPSQQCDCLPDQRTPNWRGRRLYQADRLMVLYNMKADEILPENSPNLDFDIDPKASYALRNLNIFPVEVNNADYELLLRVPGIGVTSAQKIIYARKKITLTHDVLKKLGVSLKKSVYFITCNGKYYGGKMLGNPFLRNKLWADEFVNMQNMEQMSFFG